MHGARAAGEKSSTPANHPYREAFSRLLLQGAGAADLAEHAMAIWRQLDASLAPVIGERGVDALYQRSLYLLRDRAPWLAAVHEAGFRPAAAPAFKATLAHQDRLVAASVCADLLEGFRGLLVTLLGDELTARLLEPGMDPTP